MKLNRRKGLTQLLEDAWNWIALAAALWVGYIALMEVIG